MQVTPLQDRVLVEKVVEDARTSGGIIIPDNHAEKPSKGKIITVGQGHRKEDGSFTSLTVKAGDLILFGKYSGTEIKIEEHEYLIMKEDDILGILQ